MSNLSTGEKLPGLSTATLEYLSKALGYSKQGAILTVPIRSELIRTGLMKKGKALGKRFTAGDIIDLQTILIYRKEAETRAKMKVERMGTAGV